MRRITVKKQVDRVKNAVDRLDRVTGGTWLKSNVDNLVNTVQGKGLSASQMAASDRLLHEYERRFIC